MSSKPSGVFVPVLTPFTRDLHIDNPRFATFCKWIVSQGAGLAVFGTNSEANSLSTPEKRVALDALIADGVSPAHLVPGTGACSVTDAIEMSEHAVRAGCAGVLMLPPFYYKGATDAGLADYYSRVIDKIGSSKLKVLLYHIPQLTGVPITFTLIERLIKQYPNTVVGIKDSSGDWANCEGMLKNFPDFAIFPASESFLAKAMPLGAAGCISATANLQPAGISEHVKRWREPGMDDRHKKVDAVRQIMQKTNMIPALKYVTATYGNDAEWSRVRPPFETMTDAVGKPIVDALREVGFATPGWGK
ncbi:MAG: dihydrodipicolinate synthase family protein [Burkholderiales bacterium]